MENELEDSMSTKAVHEHAWLENLIGEWSTVTEMIMGPDMDPITGNGHEIVKKVGGLWAFTEGTTTMPDGAPMEYYFTLGFDVNFKEYRGCWFASASSHLWKQTGELSSDGKTMTLLCEGPDMVVDGKTAMYKDVIELVDAKTRTYTSYCQDDSGNWQQFMKSNLNRTI